MLTEAAIDAPPARKAATESLNTRCTAHGPHLKRAHRRNDHHSVKLRHNALLLYHDHSFRKQNSRNGKKRSQSSRKGGGGAEAILGKSRKTILDVIAVAVVVVVIAAGVPWRWGRRHVPAGAVIALRRCKSDECELSDPEACRTEHQVPPPRNRMTNLGLRAASAAWTAPRNGATATARHCCAAYGGNPTNHNCNNAQGNSIVEGQSVLVSALQKMRAC